MDASPTPLVQTYHSHDIWWQLSKQEIHPRWWYDSISNTRHGSVFATSVKPSHSLRPIRNYIDLISASQPPQECNTPSDINLGCRAFCRPLKCMLIRTLWEGELRPWYRLSCGWVHGFSWVAGANIESIYFTWTGNLFNNICTQANACEFHSRECFCFSSPLLLIGKSSPLQVHTTKARISV